jgi:hypothetical protein
MFFLVLLSILALAFTAPTKLSPAPFLISKIMLMAAQSNPNSTQNQITMTIQHANPNATLTAAATCGASWDPDMLDWPTEWIPCTDAPEYEGRGAEFSWYFEYFNGIVNFSIQIRHGLLDERCVHSYVLKYY